MRRHCIFLSLICVVIALSAEAQGKASYRHLLSIDIGYWSLNDFKANTYYSDYDLQWKPPIIRLSST